MKRIHGLDLGVRLLQDVRRVGRFCGAFPRLTNALVQNGAAGGFLKQALGIHPARRLPPIPEEDFFTWWKHRKPTAGAYHAPRRKVAYFVGCTGGYLFPQVPKAAVRLLEANGVAVMISDQRCCGMPFYLEGDRGKALQSVRFNIEHLFEAVADGFDIVCSCPTCGFMLKSLVPEGAVYSDAYQQKVGAAAGRIKIPEKSSVAGKGAPSFKVLRKDLFASRLKDDGYFSAIDPIRRIRVGEHTFDLGEYLSTRIDPDRNSLSEAIPDTRILYYPPCHLREQQVGLPYLDIIMKRRPGIDLRGIEGNFYCCGISGIMGFKKAAHPSSVRLAEPLIEKIDAVHPDLLLTDCLSCRLQFEQLTHYPVRHPIELLAPRL